MTLWLQIEAGKSTWLWEGLRAESRCRRCFEIAQALIQIQLALLLRARLALLLLLPCIALCSGPFAVFAYPAVAVASDPAGGASDPADGASALAAADASYPVVVAIGVA